MVVALGALNPHTHEHLSDVFGDLQNIGFVLIVVGGWVLECATIGTQQFLHPLVDGNVAGDLVLKPVVIKKR